MRFVVCPDCGNKRCPKAHNHLLACTNSNDVGQIGSSWAQVKPFASDTEPPEPPALTIENLQPEDEDAILALARDHGLHQCEERERAAILPFSLALLNAARTNQPAIEPPQATPAVAPVAVGTVLRYGRNSRGVAWHGATFPEDGSIDLPEGTPLYIEQPSALNLDYRALWLDQISTNKKLAEALLTTPAAPQTPERTPFGYTFEVYCLPLESGEMEWVEKFQRNEPKDNPGHIRNVVPLFR